MKQQIEQAGEGSTPYGNPEDVIEEEKAPGIVVCLSAIQQRLDLEAGEKKQKKGVDTGKIWIKLTFESVKYVKETLDKEIDKELKQKNTWNKNKISFNGEDVEFRRKDILEELQEKKLVTFMYPFALCYYYELRPYNTEEMYENELFETIRVVGAPSDW